METPRRTKKVLFLCTGNYFRSRFAEIYFNTHASALNLPWRAESRGFATSLISDRMGHISRYAIEGLQSRGISVANEVRHPMQLQLKDLEEAALIIAVKEEEHRPFLLLQFPDWAEKVEYWNVHDLDVVTAEQALEVIEQQIQSLLQRLAKNT